MILTKKNKIIFLNCIFFLSFSITNLQVAYSINFKNTKPSTNNNNIEISQNQVEKRVNDIDKFQILYNSIFERDNAESLILADSLINIAKRINDNEKLEIAYTTKALYEYSERNFNEAINNALIAEKYNSINSNFYKEGNLKLDIGNIYFHSKNYETAEKYFLEALNIFSTIDGYEAKRSFTSTWYNLSKIYWVRKDLKKFEHHVDQFKKNIQNLNERDKIIENAYYQYLYGGILYNNKDYLKSIEILKKSIQIIKENKDFTNEHIIYLYLGKNLWQLNKKEEAIKYFEKVDSLFKKKKFLNYELREAYDYLIQYYKEDRNIEKQLEYTESLISLNKQFENEQKSLSNTLHYEYETKKLEESKAQLSKQLDYNNKVIVIIIILAVLFIIISIKFGIRQKKENKILRDKFDHLIKELDHESNESSNNQKNCVSKIELTPTEVKISKFLKVFESF